MSRIPSRISSAKTIFNFEDGRRIYDLNGYQIEISKSRTHESIKQIWQNIEKNNSVPCFLTWNWISTWIDTYNPALISVTASFNDQVVAIGLFTESKEVRHGIISSHQLRLHQIGDQDKDQIWIEYNDFLCEEDHQDSAVNTCFEILNYQEFRWEELIVSMMTRERVTRIANALQLEISDSPIPGYYTNLDDIRQRGLAYLETLSSNTRYQIRRSIKLYEEKFGTLQMIDASTTGEALSYFHECGRYHIKKWSDSGFKNPCFIEFHENLIRNAFESGGVNLSKLMAGDETIAILYHHLTGKQVYFYLHGINYHQQKNLKPGLVAHAIAAQSYLQRGMSKYDYMGGDNQYKTQLANEKMEFNSLIIQRPLSRFKFEHVARIIKKRIMSALK